MKATIPSIIENFPLNKVQSIFEMAVIASLLEVRSYVGIWSELSWLCLLNEVDPSETAIALRELSESIRLKKPEPNVHPDSPARAAALLLWLTGQEEDDNKAANINPNSFLPLTYKEDYLLDPSQSIFPLERRHAEIVLNNAKLTLNHRIMRTEELWLDPNFEPPDAFVKEIRKMASKIDGRGITHEVHSFEHLQPVLARCAPDLLASLTQQKLTSMKTCPSEHRYWSAVALTKYILLTGTEEAEAARKLRLSSKDDDKDKESIAVNYFLMMEILNMEAFEQFDTLIKADFNISQKFANIIRPPTQKDIDELISRYSTKSDKQQDDLLILLSVCQIQLSDNSWLWVERFAREKGTSQREEKLRKFAFKILAHANPKRFGQMLNSKKWSWHSSKNPWVNHYGTYALIKASSNTPFDQLASRLAPWQLLEAVQLRGNNPDEMRIASEILGEILFGINISDNSPYLEEIDSKDFEAVLLHAPTNIERWLEGLDDKPKEFRRRIHLAGKTYTMLCEALLIHDPERGVKLWRALHEIMTSSYIGRANPNDLLHMIFRVPDSSQVTALRKELIELKYCNTDKALLNILIAASYNDRGDWTDSIIKEDKKSEFAWKRRRAIILAGFSTNNELPVDNAWPTGEIKTVYDELHLKSARQKWIEACARHWWQAFLKASNQASAYAAWILFLRSADRRADIWIRQDIETAKDPKSELFKLKITHAELNKSTIENTLKKRSDKLNKNFLGRKTTSRVGLWR